VKLIFFETIGASGIFGPPWFYGVPGFIEPCQPSKVDRPPSGPLWVHEIKHDDYWLMVRGVSAASRAAAMTRQLQEINVVAKDWAVIG
jgi:hypothetical protein